MKKAGQNKDFCPVIIRKPSKITPDDKSMTIKKGKKRKISYGLPQGSTSSKITFSSSNKKIATVSSAGVVKAKKKGKCKYPSNLKKKKYHNDIFCRSSVIQYSQIKK